jgi:hypothetical protein
MAGVDFADIPENIPYLDCCIKHSNQNKFQVLETIISKGYADCFPQLEAKAASCRAFLLNKLSKIISYLGHIVQTGSRDDKSDCFRHPVSSITWVASLIAADNCPTILTFSGPENCTQSLLA